MPKTKSPSTTTKKPKTKTTKKPVSKKKAKPVVVDVINDDALEEKDLFPDFPVADKLVLEAKEEVKERDEIDQQKKFFSNLVTEMKEKKGPVNRFTETNQEENGRVRKNIGLYRRLVWKFLILVGLLVIIVAYFSFSKLTIIISPKGEILSDALFLKVSQEQNLEEDLNDPRTAIEGELKEIESNIEKTYSATGEEFLGEDITGKVKLINNYSKSQALVATTRLLSPDNKLYRITEAVNIPAGGQVEVGIYTEKPTEDMAINPTTFTIPGLWLGLQDKIYAKSDEKFVFKQKIQKYIKQSDLERARQDLNDLLLQAAKEDEEASLKKDENWLYEAVGPATIEINAKVGEQKDDFTAQAKGKIVAVSFSREQAAKLATNKLNLLIPDDKELIEFDPKNISYSLENYDTETKVATIKASFMGTMALRNDSEIIDRSQLVNLTKEQIETYLRDFPEIKDYELKFSPAFIKKAPSLVDRINIRIKSLN